MDKYFEVLRVGWRAAPSSPNASALLRRTTGRTRQGAEIAHRHLADAGIYLH